MFVRKKQNKSGKISIQVIDKSSGKYRVIKTIGSSSDPNTVDRLLRAAKEWVAAKTAAQEFDFSKTEQTLINLIEAIESVKIVGIELLLGRIFDEIGFNKIKDPIFRHLVLYRLVYPVSKLKTTEYLYRYEQLSWDEDKVYRYLDKLYHHQKEQVQQISYHHTRQILGGQPRMVFYDVTTLYFEIDEEDDLRQRGFSKEGKHQNAQIVLGLLVSENGYPLAYDVYEGSKFEGHTLLPVIEQFKTKYQLQNLTIIADAGLLSNSNIELLIAKGYEFIIGARIKNESVPLQQKILSQSFGNGETRIFEKMNDIKLVVSYSEKRATKDARNRQRGLARLEKQIRKGRLTKSHINNKGYNKYLKMNGDVTIEIDYGKYDTDGKWDGLKGYLTNSLLSAKEIIDNYNQLWQIEKAFRVTKTDLKIRPIYHRLPKRIEAHICLNFVAYKVYKELERQLKEKKAAISANTAIDIASFILAITIKIPLTGQRHTRLLLKTEEQKMLAELFNF